MSQLTFLVSLLLTWSPPTPVQLATLSGFVRDARTHLGVPRALISAFGQTGRSALSIHTDDDGYYRIQLAPDTYTIIVDDGRHLPSQLEIAIGMENKQKDIDMEPTTPLSVSESIT